MTDHEHVLAERLLAAADDGGRPLSGDADSLLLRARRTRRRRRTTRGAAVVVAVAAITTAVLVVPSLGEGSADSRSVAPAGSGESGPTATDPATTEATPPAEDVVLDDAEVVRRCLPQLTKYYDLPQYGRGDWQVAHDRAYRAGDVVLLHEPGTIERDGFVFSTGPNPVLCLVPEEGREQDPVPFSTFTLDSDDPARVGELCSESWNVGTDEYAATWQDLRGSDVVVLDRRGPVATALLDTGDELLTCTLAPVTWDTGIPEVGLAARDDLFLNGTSTIKSIVDESATYYYGAGVTDPRTTRLVVRLVDGRFFTRPVGPDGAWAVMIRVPGSGGVEDVEVVAMDATGVSLATGRS